MKREKPLVRWKREPKRKGYKYYIRNEKQGITSVAAELKKEPRGYYELDAKAFEKFDDMDKFPRRKKDRL